MATQMQVPKRTNKQFLKKELKSELQWVVIWLYTGMGKETQEVAVIIVHTQALGLVGDSVDFIT